VPMMGVTDMVKPEELVGKTISKVEIGKDMAFVNFTDGTSISVAHDGDRINMMHNNPNRDWRKGSPVDLVESPCLTLSGRIKQHKHSQRVSEKKDFTP